MDMQVVLVGHDLGGLSVTYGLENYHQKVSVGVYIAAMMLPSGFPLTLEVISTHKLRVCFLLGAYCICTLAFLHYYVICLPKGLHKELQFAHVYVSALHAVVRAGPSCGKPHWVHIRRWTSCHAHLINCHGEDATASVLSPVSIWGKAPGFNQWHSHPLAFLEKNSSSLTARAQLNVLRLFCRMWCWRHCFQNLCHWKCWTALALNGRRKNMAQSRRCTSRRWTTKFCLLMLKKKLSCVTPHVYPQRFGRLILTTVPSFLSLPNLSNTSRKLLQRTLNSFRLSEQGVGFVFFCCSISSLDTCTRKRAQAC